MTPTPPTFDPVSRRYEISTDSAHRVLVAAAQRLIEAYDDYEDALDSRVSLGELQLFDQQVAHDELAHTSALTAQADA